jgi:hypothetical protein
MKPRDLDVEWIKKILADLERNRSDPQIAALMDMSEAASPAQRVENAVERARSPSAGSISAARRAAPRA